MTRDLDGVLASIDGALGDYTVSGDYLVSGDAMRWTPVPPEQQPAPRWASLGFAVEFAAEQERAAERVRAAFHVDEEALERFRETCRQVGRSFADLAEALNPVMQKLGEALAQLRPPSSPPPPALRATDPRAYALELHRTRGTGPDRQVQHRPRPRQHS